VPEDADPVALDDKGPVVLVADREGRVELLRPGRPFDVRLVLRVGDLEACEQEQRGGASAGEPIWLQPHCDAPSSMSSSLSSTSLPSPFCSLRSSSRSSSLSSAASSSVSSMTASSKAE